MAPEATSLPSGLCRETYGRAGHCFISFYPQNYSQPPHIVAQDLKLCVAVLLDNILLC